VIAMAWLYVDPSNDHHLGMKDHIQVHQIAEHQVILGKRKLLGVSGMWRS
jgi:hypothetical protein